jgi:retron-type reverse transcriptase
VKPKLVRKGLPQGLSISPILATMVLDSLPSVEGLVMYADDGVILSEKKEDTKIFKWFEDLKIFGLTLEPTKSGYSDGKFKFVGVEFDLTEETVRYKESTYS